MSENLEFVKAVRETLKNEGPPPLIGTFDPKLGDVGQDQEGNYYAWNGERWIGNTKQSVTLDEWLRGTQR